MATRLILLVHRTQRKEAIRPPGSRKALEVGSHGRSLKTISSNSWSHSWTGCISRSVVRLACHEICLVLFMQLGAETNSNIFICHEHVLAFIGLVI